MFARRVAGRTNRRGIPSSSAGPVTPLTIIKSVPVLQWIRADKGITIGTGVSAWADQSGNGNNFSQAGGTQQPAYNAADATLSNLPTVNADGVNDVLNDAMPLSPANNIFMSGIVKFNVWGTSKAIWGSIGLPEGMELAAYAGFTTPQLGQYNGVISNPNAGLPVGTWGRAEQLQSTTASYTKLNSIVSSATGNAGPNAITGTQLFGTTGAAFMSSAVAERVVTQGKPTTAEIAALDAYYVARYGVEVVYGNPLSIFGSAGVLQWVRADKGITLGTGVSAWADQTANGWNYSQATGGQQPAYNASDATLGNLPTLTFDGINDNLQSSLNLPASGTTPTCVLAVAKLGAFAAQGILVSQNGNTGNQCTISTVSSSAVDSLNGSTVVGAYAAGTWYRFRADYSNSAGDIFRVGSAQTTGSAGNQTTQAGRGIGGFATGSFPQAATAFELVHLNFIPSAAQLAAYDAYVNALTKGAVQL